MLVCCGDVRCWARGVGGGLQSPLCRVGSGCRRVLVIRAFRLRAWGSQARARLRHFGGQLHFEYNT